MIIENVIINNEKDYQQFIVKYNDIISRIKSLYDRNSDKDIDPLEINIKADLNLGISFRGNITVPIPKPVRERYIFAAIPNASSNRDDIMMFEKMHDDKVKIVGCEDVSSEIHIPEKVRDDEGGIYSTVTIGLAFWGSYYLKHLIIPESVYQIEMWTFQDCYNLESVIIPSKARISKHAFKNCKKLKKISCHKSGKPCKYGYSFYRESDDVITVPISTVTKEICNGCYMNVESLISIIIPDSITKIGNGVFQGCTNLTSISIPNSVVEIGHHAFTDCSKLESIEIPNSVTEIGGSCFRRCSILKSIKLPNRLSEIDFYTFGGCTGLKSIELPNSVKTIKVGAFFGCENLESITNCKSLHWIDDDAFRGCEHLESIDFPDTMTYIGDHAFYLCVNLKFIKLSPISMMRIGYRAFKDCIQLRDVDLNSSATIEIHKEAFRGCLNLKSIIIPNSTTYIGPGAFVDCKALETVTLPNLLTDILDHTFENCLNLKKITNTEYVECIGNYTFSQCTNLQLINIQNVKKIGKGAFWSCTSLKTIRIPEGIDTISMKAFEKCSSLEEISLPTTLKCIDSSAFSCCINLIQIAIPDGVNEIHKGAFAKCFSLEHISFPTTLEMVGNLAFASCLNLNNIELPESLRKVGEGVFNLCTNLESFTIPNCFGIIPSRMFCGCKKLKNIVIPNGVSTIKRNAFSNCADLENVKIPDSVKEICASAFLRCSKIKKIDLGNNVEKIGAYAFSQCREITELSIPSSVKELGAGFISGCSKLEKISISSDNYSIDNNVIYKNSERGRILHSFVNFKEECFKIPSGTSIIANSAFYCADNLKSVELPETTKIIESHAFKECSNLHTVKIPKSSVVSIEACAFSLCKELTNTLLPDSLQYLGPYAFRGTSITHITIPTKINEIQDSTFMFCTHLRSINIPETVKIIGSSAFYHCTSLNDVHIAEGIESIGNFAFSHCGIENITIPKSVVNIGRFAFSHCPSLKQIIIPPYLQKLGENIVANCHNLDVVTSQSTSDNPTSDYICEDNAIYNTKGFLCSATAVAKDYHIPQGVNIIQSSAFAGCGKITEIFIPDNIMEIKNHAITNCMNLRVIEIKSSETSFNKLFYSKCPKLEKIFTPDETFRFIQLQLPKQFLNGSLPIPLENTAAKNNFMIPKATAKLLNDFNLIAKRSYIQTIFLRNKQHNIGSHVTAKCSDPTFVNELLKRNTPNYKPLFDGKLNPNLPVDAEHQLAKLNDYNFQRDSYCTDLAESISGSCENITIRDLFYFLDSNTLLLNLISGYDKKFKYHFEIYFEEDQNCANIDDPRLDLQIAIPNGQIGCHAFYNIIENVIRNTAKYAHNNPDNDVAICFRFRTEYQENSSKRLLSNDYYFVEIYSNIEQPDIEKLVDKLNGFVRMPIIDRDTMKPRTEAKGLIEMKASAAYLRGQDIVNLDDDAYTLDEHKAVKDYQEHISVNNKYGVPIQLKAFALCITPQHIVNENATTFFGNRIPVYFHINSNKKCNYYHYLSEGEDTIHRGFLGYRFFMLKPKNVLLVGDAGEKNTTVPSEYGIDLWSIQQLEKHLKNNNNVHYDIMICSEKDILSKYKSRLPKRIIKMSAAEFIQNFISKHPDYKSKNPKTLSSLIEAFAWSMYPEWLKASDYNIFSTSSCPCFSDHLHSLTKEKFEAKDYIEALSSAAQQKLPNFLRLSDNKDLSHYTVQAWSNPLTLYRILESINTKVLLLDEDIQLEAKAPPTSLREPKIDLKLHLQKCRIDIPDINLVGITPEDAIKVIERVKEEGENYDFIFFHYGLLERMFEQMDDGQLIRLRTLYPGINSDSHDRKKIMVDYLKTLAKEHDVVIKSGRGIPETLPPSVRFIPQVNVNQALKELKSKYLFSNQLYASR